MFKTLRLAFLLTLPLPLGSASAEPAVTISGTVVDVYGRPAANAEVGLSAGPIVSLRLESLFNDVARPVEIVARTTTDADGAFSIERSDAGRETYWARTWLVLWAHRPGSALATYTLGSDWPANAAPIMVRLKDASALPIEVAAPDGRPLANAKVSPERLDNLRLPRELASRLVSVCDGAGRAVLRDLSPAGLDLVRVETKEYGVQLVSLPAANAGGDRKIVLAPVGTIHGRLTADDPRAVAAVPIWLATSLVAGDESAGGGLGEVVSGADGQFEAPAIAAGTLSVSADVPGGLPFHCSIIADRPLKEATAMELTVKLERAVRVEGVVRDRDSGAPLSGAVVLPYYWLPRSLTRSDAQGRYGGFLLPGQVSPWVRRVPRGYYIPPGARNSQSVPGGVPHVELKPLLLAKGVTLGGRVVDAAGKPVAAAEVEAHWEDASGEDGAAHAYSDRNGAYTLDGVEPQMQVKLTAWSIHGATAEAVSVPSETKGAIELVISPANGSRLEGRVVDVMGRPIAGAAVQIRGQRRGAHGNPRIDRYICFDGRQRLLTDEQGRFRTPAALDGGLEYSVEITAPGMLPETAASSRKTANLGDLVLREVPSLRAIDGKIVDRRGKPLAGLRVFQAGDGPRRTETTTDADGRFRLNGVYAGSVFLLVHGKGYPLQGFLCDGERPAEFLARSEDESAARQFKTLAEPLSLPQRRETSLRLIEPMLPALKQGEVEAEKVWVLVTLAVLDRDHAVDFANLPIFKQLGLNLADELSYYSALAMIAEDEAEALAVGESIATAHHRGRLYLAVCDRLPDAERGRKAELLATALLHARAETDMGERVNLMGQIAERWLDLGERERGTALLREGQALAEGLPAPSEAAEIAHDSAAHMRAYFAGSLARIDGPAAVKLSTGFPNSQFANRYRIGVALGLAAHDVQAVERLLDEGDASTGLYWNALRVLHRMAGIDLERAARLARKCDSDNERGYALGIVAHGGSPRDAARAAELLHEAYVLLEQASADGVGASETSAHPAVLAAALLPVAEYIDPALVERCFWRALAMRSPRPLRPHEQLSAAVVPGVLAIFISRYDRAAARVLAQPVAAEVQRLTSGDYWVSKLSWTSLAVVDAAWATSLIDKLPEPPPLDFRAAKNVARRNVAEALAPSADNWWHKLYKQGPHLRDPDARDDERYP